MLATYRSGSSGSTIFCKKPVTFPTILKPCSESGYFPQKLSTGLTYSSEMVHPPTTRERLRERARPLFSSRAPRPPPARATRAPFHRPFRSPRPRRRARTPSHPARFSIHRVSLFFSSSPSRRRPSRAFDAPPRRRACRPMNRLPRVRLVSRALERGARGARARSTARVHARGRRSTVVPRRGMASIVTRRTPTRNCFVLRDVRIQCARKSNQRDEARRGRCDRPSAEDPAEWFRGTMEWLE